MIRDPDRLNGRTFDVLVVGGGIYGLTIAYDAAQRGLSVALIERDDFGSGATFNHLRTIHGGLRYLQSLDLKRARESVRERRADQFQSGIFHLTAQGATSWHGFASSIVEAARGALPAATIAAREVLAIATSDYPTPARRPSNSQLNNAKLEQRFSLVRHVPGRRGASFALRQVTQPVAVVHQECRPAERPVQVGVVQARDDDIPRPRMPDE